MDKKLPREKMDELLDLARKYYHIDASAPDEDALQEMMETAKDLERKADLGIFSLLDFVSGIIRSSGIKRDATNEDVYKTLEVLGWTVE